MPNAPLPDPGSQSPAEQLFAEYEVDLQRGAAPDFEFWCRSQPDHATELRRLKSAWDARRALAERAGLGSVARMSFAEKLRSLCGSNVDPGVSLGGGAPGPDSGPSSELLRRLRAHAPVHSRYRMLGEVGRGGMGAVLKIWDEDLRRTLAMKVVLGKDEGRSGDTPSMDARMLGRFLEEAQVTGQLDHPGIVPVHELGLGSDGHVYFTMRLVKGEDLRQVYDYVASGHEGWNPTRALGVLLKVCEAMSYAHDKGVVHRDLKPANVMVGKYGEVYVMDWGLARVLGHADLHDVRLKPEAASGLAVQTERRAERAGASDSPLVTMDGDVVGTPAYMPPEQARGDVDKLGPHSDVYALGAMLYHLLAGQMPFVPPKSSDSAVAVLMRVLAGPPVSLAQLAPDTPAELVAICEKAMERDPAQRYRDMLALAQDLRAYLEQRVVKAYESGTWAETKKWVQRNKPLALSLAAAVLLLAAGLTVSLGFKAQADENLELATLRAADLAIETHKAQEKEREATQKANDVLSLSAIQDLKELEERADALWPAEPENVPKYEAWLADARLLIEGQAADPARGVKKRFSLAEHEAKLREIRQQARDRTPDEVEADRRASPSFAAWQKSQAELQWMRRMLGEEPWPAEAEVQAALAAETLPEDARALNAIAWPLVETDPARIVYGSEVRAFELARRAVAAAGGNEQAMFRDTLAWALFRTGRFEDARAEERRAAAEIEDAKKAEYEGYLAKLERAIALWSGADSLAERRAESSALASRLAALQQEVDEHVTYAFEDGEARWWYAQLSKLVSDLNAFQDEKTGGLYSNGSSEQHGWGIVKRMEFARTIAERSVSGAEAQRRWDEAIAAIAGNALYGGLRMTPQLGLLPIGADPDSHFSEFAHLQTGEPAQRGADGKLIVQEATGLVFVLIPRQTFWMGAQSKDKNGPNYDPRANSPESPVHEVTLSPYFLSKYEMTQGQWERFTGRNPSSYPPWSKHNGRQHDLTHPVENVTWRRCMEVMTRLGLELPSEARWECGARAGTSTPWWTGAERESLRGKVNVADGTAAKGGASWVEIKDWPDLEDGWVVHAAAGSFAANAFGLHEVAGNVWEWCLDGFDNYPAGPQLDPVIAPSSAHFRATRGGSFEYAAARARAAYRVNNPPDLQSGVLGVRPARSLTP